MEKERKSSLVAENKKDIHGLFNVVDNKRICMFCEWTTVRNLTRMRTHIAMQCQKVPGTVRACFVKDDIDGMDPGSQGDEDYDQKDVETYQVVTLDDNRWDESGIQVVNSKDVNVEDDQLDLDEQELEPNYLEVQELDEQNCAWCGKSLSCVNLEVEDGSEVFCSDRCLNRHVEKSRGFSVHSTDSNVRISGQKRMPARIKHDSPEAPTKKIKVLVVSDQGSPQAVRVKKEYPRSGDKRKDDRNVDAPTVVEMVDYTPEHDADPLQEDPLLPSEALGWKKKDSTPNIAAKTPEKSPEKTGMPKPSPQPKIQEKVSRLFKNDSLALVSLWD